MANAVASAPSKIKEVEIELQGHIYKVRENSNEYLALKMEFDPEKKYMFNLAEENIPREYPVMEVRDRKSYPLPHQKFKPFQNIVFTSQIIWNGSRTIIRYYDGCDSIFISKQPKEKEVVDQFIAQTKKRNFLDGSFGCNGDEKMLLLYMYICSWNAESPFRTKSANQIFIPVDKAKKASAEASKLDIMEKALLLAKEASETKMLIHAAYLGIPDTDYDSGNKLEPSEIRIEYRKAASRNPSEFIKSLAKSI